jgi:hypothetical protein
MITIIVDTGSIESRTNLPRNFKAVCRNLLRPAGTTGQRDHDSTHYPNSDIGFSERSRM